MVVASCRVVLHLPDSRSLKAKRQVLRGLVERLRSRHNLSVVEIEGRDLWQKAVLATALAARDRREAESRLDRARQEIEELTGLKAIDFEVEFHTREEHGWHTG